jgi:hypothetical protein
MHDPYPRADFRSAVFHPGVFKAIVGLAVLFVAAAWGFAGGGITDMLLVVVSGFIFVSAGLVTLLWLTRRRHPRGATGRAARTRSATGPVATSIRRPVPSAGLPR